MSSFNPSTPAEEMDMFTQLLNRIYAPQIGFRVSAWREEKMGDHIHTVAVIQVRNLRQ